MKKSRSHMTEILNILLICFISYINFSIPGNSLVITLISSVILAVIFSVCTAARATVNLCIGLAASALIFMLEPVTHDLNYIFESCIAMLDLFLPAFVLSLCFSNKKLGLGKTLYFTTGANLLVNLLSLAKIRYIDKINLIEQVNTVYDEIFSTYTSLIAGSTAIEGAGDITAVFDAIKELSVMLIPALLIISCMAVSYILIVATRGMLKTYFREEHTEIEYFFQLRTGKLLSTVTIVLLLLAFMSGDAYFTSAIYNFAVIAGFIYFINGLSVVYFYLIKSIRVVPLAMLVLAVAFIVSLFAAVLMPAINVFTLLFVVGLLDSSANFRRLKKVGE